MKTVRLIFCILTFFIYIKKVIVQNKLNLHMYPLLDWYSPTNMVINHKNKKSNLFLFQIIQILKKKYCKLKFILLPGIYYEESPSSLYDFIVTNQFIFRLKYFYTMCPSLCVLLNQAYWHLSSVTRVSKMVLKHFVTKSKWVSRVNFHKNEKKLD